MRVAVIGGGIVGLSTAYFLAKKGIEVTVFEKKYLLYGASGRNFGGITLQLDSPELIKLAKRSFQLYDELSSEIGFNILLRRDGGIRTANSEEDLKKLKRDVALQNSVGVRSKIISPEEVKDFIPDFNEDSAIIASYCEDDGVLFPWPVIWCLAKGCKELGVDIRLYSEVNKIESENMAIRGVYANGEFFKADFVVNAGGAWSNHINQIAGIELRNKIIKEETCVTESIKPWLNPYILDLTRQVYLCQTVRGEIVGGIVGRECETLTTSSTLDFLIEFSKKAVGILPKLKGLALLRQWAGVYDKGADNMPVLGFTKIEGFVEANGLGKLGMSIGLSVGEEIAKLIIRGGNNELKKFDPSRFLKS